MILSIDPGPEQSAYVLLDDNYRIIKFDICKNDLMFSNIQYMAGYDTVVIEMIASYGMPVGAEVFETCVWIGRFIQASKCKVERLLS